MKYGKAWENYVSPTDFRNRQRRATSQQERGVTSPNIKADVQSRFDKMQRLKEKVGILVEHVEVVPLELWKDRSLLGLIKSDPWLKKYQLVGLLTQIYKNIRFALLPVAT